MKLPTCAALITLGLTSTGCITAQTIDLARGCPVTFEQQLPAPETDPSTVEPVTYYKTSPDAAYYLLVPFALAADIVASPYEIIAKATNPDWTFFPYK
jgi:hypothetical protein